MIDFTPFITSLHLTSLLKVGILIALSAFLIFLIVVYKQIDSMNKLVTQTSNGKFLQFISFLLILGALALFLISLAIL